MMLSRVAENIYWMNRYLERVHNTARLILTTSHLMLDLPRYTPMRWSSLIDVLGSGEYFSEADIESLNETMVCRLLIADDEFHGSILSNARMARENSRVSREVIPSEVWEYINHLYLYVKDNARLVNSRAAREQFLSEVIEKSHAIHGAIRGTLSRGAAYQFAKMGTNVERADMTTRILDGRVSEYLLHEPDEGDHTYFYNAAWVGILQSVSGLEMYRRSVNNAVGAKEVIHFLLLDTNFPRSVGFCIADTMKALDALALEHSTTFAMQALTELNGKLMPTKIEVEYLQKHMDDLQLGLIEVAEALAKEFFLPSNLV